MILRGAVMSLEPISLFAKPPETRVQESTPIVSEICAEPPPAPQLQLSIETVAEWLVVQDAGTREHCAALLDGELTQLRAQARAEGFSQGEASGLEAAKEQTTAELEVLSSFAQAAEAAFEQEVANLTQTCTSVIAEAFVKLAGTALVSQDAIVGMVREVLARVKEARELIVRVSAEDLPHLQTHSEALAQRMGRRKMELVADARVHLGGCIVESRLGNLDGRLEVQLNQLFETLRSARTAPTEVV